MRMVMAFAAIGFIALVVVGGIALAIILWAGLR
jgi:hypothetical protein